MKIKFAVISFLFVLIISLFFQSCNNNNRKRSIRNFSYDALKDSMNIENYDPTGDSSNVFDSKDFTPGVDSLDTLLIKMDTMWHIEAGLMDQPEMFKKIVKTEEKYTKDDKAVIKDNIKVLDSFLIKKNDSLTGSCKEKECPLFAEIVKSKQKLFLYIDGQLKDSFKVSTGIKKYETPEMDLRPMGPVLTPVFLG